MFRIVDLFSGIGGFSLAASWIWGADLEIVCFCEQDKFCQRVLHKHWPNVPIVEDVNNVEEIAAYAYSNGRRSRSSRNLDNHSNKPAQHNRGEGETTGWENYKGQGCVDLLTGGVPCQPASCAGKRKGTEDDRWLWPQALAVVDRIKPRWVIFENPTGFLTLNSGVEYESVLAHLEAQGYWTESFILPASAAGAPHRRDRIWIVAKSNAIGCGWRENHKGEKATIGNWTEEAITRFSAAQEPLGKEFEQVLYTNLDQLIVRTDCHAPNSNIQGSQVGEVQPGDCGEELKTPIGNPWDEHWYAASARLCRIHDGLPGGIHRTSRLKALGNSIAPHVVARIMQAIRLIDHQNKENPNG